MFYHINPNYRYQFFSPHIEPRPGIPEDPVDAEPIIEPKRNLVNALAALYKAYDGKEELNNNAVDIIYKIANVISEKNSTPNNPPEEALEPGDRELGGE